MCAIEKSDIISRAATSHLICNAFISELAHFVLAHVARTQRTRRSTDQSVTTVRLSMPIIVTNVSTGAVADDAELQLHLQPSQRLIDDAFVYIKRFENSSVLINDYHKLAEQIGGCFYRDARAALDLCEDGVVS